MTMLEESFNAIECPVARRKTNARCEWPDGTTYPPANLAGERGKRAASEMQYTDAMVCEDNIKHKRPFSRSPTDCQKCFNVTQRASSEAVEECMRIPKDALARTAEAFNALSIDIETSWGPTPLLT